MAPPPGPRRERGPVLRNRTALAQALTILVMAVLPLVMHLA